MIMNFVPSDFEGEYENIEDCPVARTICRNLDVKPFDIGVGSQTVNFYEKSFCKDVLFFGETKLNGEVIARNLFESDHYDIIKEAIKNNTFQSASVELIEDDPFHN